MRRRRIPVRKDDLGPEPDDIVRGRIRSWTAQSLGSREELYRLVNQLPDEDVCFALELARHLLGESSHDSLRHSRRILIRK